MKNTLAKSTMAFLLMTATLSMMPLLAASQVRCSYDSRGAFCNSYSDKYDYETHAFLTQCILEQRANPVVPREYVQAGAGAVGVMAYNPRLLLCVYGKRGLTINVNGRQQLDLERMRKILINYIQQTVQDPQSRRAQIWALRSCQNPYDPYRFEIPFSRCLAQAESNHGKSLNQRQDIAEIEYQVQSFDAMKDFGP